MFAIPSHCFAGLLLLLCCHTPFTRAADVPLAIAWSSDGKLVACGLGSGEIELWDVDRSTSVARWQAHKGGIEHLKFSAEGTWLATTGPDSRLGVWKIPTGEPVATLTSPLYHQSRGTYYFRDIAFRGEQEVVAAIFAWRPRHLLVERWSLTSRQHEATSEPIVGGFEGALFDPQAGKLALVATNQRDIEIWDFATSQHIRTMSTGDRSLRQFAFHPDGQQIVSSTGPLTSGRAVGSVSLPDQRSLNFWNVESGDLVGSISGEQFEHALTRLAWSPDGKRLATAGPGSRLVQIWNTTDFEREATLVHRHEVVALAFDPQGTRLATSETSTGQVRVWGLPETDSIDTSAWPKPSSLP